MKKLLHYLMQGMAALVVLAFIGYTAIWFYAASIIDKKVEQVFKNQTPSHYTFSGGAPKMGGFPDAPTYNYSGKITLENRAVFEAPLLIIKGFPLAYNFVTLSAPQGFSLTSDFVPNKAIHFTDFGLRIQIPPDLPKSNDREGLTAWQKNGGYIPVESLWLNIGEFSLKGSGQLRLDETLQPAGELGVRVTGFDDYLSQLLEDEKINKQNAAMALSFINLLTQKDEATGQSYIATALRIQNGGIYLGPVNIASLPKFNF